MRRTCEGVREAQRLGIYGDVGDETEIDILDHARQKECQAVVITVPQYKSAVTILEQVRSRAPHVHTIVRSRYELHSDDLVSAGAHVVTGDEQQVGESLASHIDQWLTTSRESSGE